jgi:hypothetical protein
MNDQLDNFYHQLGRTVRNTFYTGTRDFSLLDLVLTYCGTHVVYNRIGTKGEAGGA